MTFTAGQILTAAQLNALRTPGVWDTWTPSWTNFTPGNATVLCNYFRSGNLIVAHMYIALGSTSVVGTAPIFSLPVAAASNNYGGGMTSTYRDVSASADYEGMIRLAGTASGYLLVRNVAGANDQRTHVAAAVPFTWATGDIITGYLTYEAA